MWQWQASPNTPLPTLSGEQSPYTLLLPEPYRARRARAILRDFVSQGKGGREAERQRAYIHPTKHTFAGAINLRKLSSQAVCLHGVMGRGAGSSGERA